MSTDRENHRVQIFDGRGQYQGQWNNLHRPCGLFIDRTQNGGTFYVGELGHALPVNEAVANLGPRVNRAGRQGTEGRALRRTVRGRRSRASSSPPTAWSPTHAAMSTSRRCSWTQRGQHEKPPREVRSLQKFARVA
jgi:hypothetical protein